MTAPGVALGKQAWKAPPDALLAVEQVRLRAKLRLAWIRWLYDQCRYSDVAIALEARDTAEAEAAWVAAEPNLEPVRSRLEEVESEILRSAEPGRLRRLTEVFGLEDASRDLLHLCFAVELAPELRGVLGALQYPQGFAHVTFWLVSRLFGYSLAQWSADDPLFRWRMIRRETGGAAEPETLQLDPALTGWLLGQSGWDEILAGCTRLVRGAPDAAHSLVAETARRIEELLLDPRRPRIRLQVAGGCRDEAERFAAGVCAGLGLDALLVETTADDAEKDAFFTHAQRRAFLDRCVPVWIGAQPQWPAFSTWFPLQVLLHAGVLPPREGVEDIGVDLRSPGANATSPVLDNLAQLLDCPFEQEDLVVPTTVGAALDEFVFEAENRAELWNQASARRLFPLGRGVVALFSGEPGTGKTMAVQVVARRLGLTLYRVDLSALISKWVGETSKHIEALLRAAADARVLLLFDEADSLFGKRAQEQRDAQDRYVNMDSSHLLAALETFPGVAVLATNLRGNLDHAFTRRLRHVVSFPKPGPVERLEIWRRVMTALAGAEAADALRGDLAVLAGGVELTGAEIKNACLGALFSARRSQEPLARRHLVQALTRELTKAGRSLSERERQRLMQHGG